MELFEETCWELPEPGKFDPSQLLVPEEFETRLEDVLFFHPEYLERLEDDRL